MNNKLLIKTFRNTFVAAIYILLISQIMQNGDRLFGNASNIIGPFAILLLFCLSAAVVGGLVLGETFLLFMDNKRKEGVQAAFYSIGWLAVFTFLSLLTMIIIR